MIQRKQSLYLLIVALLCSMLLIFPLANFALSVGEIADGGVYTVWGLEYLNGMWEPFVYHGILAVLAVLLPLFTIFRYKHREFQMRMCIVEGILLLGLVGFEGIGFYRLNEMLSAGGYVLDYSFVMLAPLLAIPFVIFAYKGILKDMALIKSADRIR